VSSDLQLADESTLLGLIQRGRGSGLQQALAGEAGRTRVALEACLRHDPRWDRQVEDRDLYYATVATACGFPVEEIGRLLGEYSSDPEPVHGVGPYPVEGVLGVLALRGNGVAMERLAREVREGPAWETSADALAWRLPVEAWRALGGPLFARLADEEVTNLAQARGQSLDPWQTWATSEGRYREAVAAMHPLRSKPQPRGRAVRADTALTTSALLAIVDAQNWIQVSRVLERRAGDGEEALFREAFCTGSPHQRAVALRVLASRRDPGAIEEALEFVRDRPSVLLQDEAFRYLEALPAEATLERARAWYREPWPLSLVGERVLERNATVEDLASVRAALAAAMGPDDVYRACSACKILGRIGDPDGMQEVRAFYESTPYSYGRGLAARALARIDPGFSGRTAIECLYDCEAVTRLLGVEHADPAVPGVAARLSAMAEDLAEKPEQRGAASSRVSRHLG